jgi:glycerol kinase
MKSTYPREGWVEQDPYYILSAVKTSISKAIKNGKISPSQIECAGITNQRETTIIWDRNTGIPVYNAILWQDRRTEAIMKEFSDYGPEITKKTGLRLDPYFSAGKIKWILDNVVGSRNRALRGDLVFGTVDSWLLYNLDSSHPCHTDYTNASRTMLFDIRKLEWDYSLLSMFGIPDIMLPEVFPSLNEFGSISVFRNRAIPVYSIIGDQQSALFGHSSTSKGMAKITYGTGSFAMLNTGADIPESGTLINTVAFGLHGRNVNYALEGSVFSAGYAVDWIKNLLHVRSFSRFEEMAQTAKSQNSFLVPAFSGLGSPYWDPDARALIIGLNGSSGRRDFARMAYESVAFQTEDVLREMEKASSINVARVDGGLSMSNFLMQLQSSLSGIKIIRTNSPEVTAAGAAYIAGIAAGFWGINDLHGMAKVEKEYGPEAGDKDAMQKYPLWLEAVRRSLKWTVQDIKV